MRGSHTEYIDIVNEQTEPFDAQVKRGLWETSRPVTFKTPDGVYVVGSGKRYNRFSCVPDTSYRRFWMSSLLHDISRGDHEVSRRQSDYWFFDDMAKAIREINDALRATDCPDKVVDREVVRLSRVASLYALGVSGCVGSAYIWLDKVF